MDGAAPSRAGRGISRSWREAPRAPRTLAAPSRAGSRAQPGGTACPAGPPPQPGSDPGGAQGGPALGGPGAPGARAHSRARGTYAFCSRSRRRRRSSWRRGWGPPGGALCCARRGCGAAGLLGARDTAKRAASARLSSSMAGRGRRPRGRPARTRRCRQPGPARPTGRLPGVPLRACAPRCGAGRGGQGAGSSVDPPLAGWWWCHRRRQAVGFKRWVEPASKRGRTAPLGRGPGSGHSALWRCLAQSGCTGRGSVRPGPGMQGPNWMVRGWILACECPNDVRPPQCLPSTGANLYSVVGARSWQQGCAEGFAHTGFTSS